MKGSYRVKVQNRRICYDFTIYRNITILRGDSATGKTTLIDMIAAYGREGARSGIEIACEKKCVVLDGDKWERDNEELDQCIVFIDEGNDFVRSRRFAEAVKNSTNYYVIATRESLFDLPYSVNEIYGIRNKAGNRYQGTKRLYSDLYHLYNAEAFKDKPDKIIVEDSNSAYQFFRNLCEKEHIICETANGKSNIYDTILRATDDKILVIADGAAYGPEMERTLALKRNKNVVFFLPESFEWLILRSGLIEDKELDRILEKPSEFIESEKYFSWERFFTALLIDEAKETPLAYQKRRLNPTYLHEKNNRTIRKTIEDVSGLEIFGN